MRSNFPPMHSYEIDKSYPKNGIEIGVGSKGKLFERTTVLAYLYFLR